MKDISCQTIYYSFIIIQKIDVFHFRLLKSLKCYLHQFEIDRSNLRSLRFEYSAANLFKSW